MQDLPCWALIDENALVEGFSRVVNVPSFRFFVQSFRFLYPRSGLGGPGNIHQNHPFANPWVFLVPTEKRQRRRKWRKSQLCILVTKTRLCSSDCSKQQKWRVFPSSKHCCFPKAPFHDLDFDEHEHLEAWMGLPACLGYGWFGAFVPASGLSCAERIPMRKR